MAMQAFELASQADPNDAVLHGHLGAAARRQGDLGQAETFLRSSLRQAPGQIAVLNTLGNVLLQAGRPVDALAAFDEGLVTAAQPYDLHFNRARALLALGRLVDAESSANNARSLLPAPTSALLHLQASIDTAAGRIEAARQVLEQAIAVNAAKASVHHDLATVLQRLHRFDEALAAHLQAQAIGLDVADAHYNHGNTLQSLGRLEEALGAYRRALVREPAHRLALFDLARLRWRLGHPDFDAELLLAEADPAATPVARPLRAALLLRAKRFAEAAQGYRAALAVAPHDVALHDGLARCLMQLGHTGDALAAHERAVALGPTVTTLRATYAASLLAAGQAGAAAQQAEAALVLAPHDAYALALRGQAWRELGDAREVWLNDYARFVAVIDLPAPAGYSDMAAFCNALGRELAALHVDREAPLDQTLQQGTQTVGDLFEQAHPLVHALKARIAEAVQAYIDALPADATHPFLSRRAAGWRFTDSWSSRLRRGGFHTPHVHPHGWISSVCYVAVPAAVHDTARRAGWLHLGRPEFGEGPLTEARRMVQPRVGRLVLFPSMFWHGTTPFEDAEARLTIAFDVVPS